MRVYLGVGHGIEPNGTFDPGAVGNGAREYDVNFHVCLIAHAALSRSGVDHVTETASGAGHDPDYRGSVAAVNAGHFDLAFEVHSDEAKAPRGGFGIYVSDVGRRLADMVTARWSGEGLPTRPSYRDTRGLWFLKGTTPPAVIWECDRVQEHSEAEYSAMGEAIAAGVCDWLKMPYVTGTAPAPPSPGPITPASSPLPPITDAIGVAVPSDGVGRWLAAADGGVFALDGARFFGSMGGKALNGPIVGIIGHGSGGYWLVGRDAGIFAFGDAPPAIPPKGLQSEIARGDRHIVGGFRNPATDRLVEVSNRGEGYEP